MDMVRRNYLLYLAALKLLLNHMRSFMLDHLHENYRQEGEALNQRAVEVIRYLGLVGRHALTFPHSGNHELPEWLDQRYRMVIADIDGCIAQSKFEWMLEFGFLRRVQVTAAEASSAETCSICLESFQAGSVIGIPQCGHRYHWDCITQWYDRANTCPLCRRYVLENADVRRV
ncbi:E3 ubiquitin-protein ligase RNF43-like [Phoenix dactylifera]|uniref:E3 ubiquitin-protein ligase RNF43-like n=1 Tax=Phoenix dactylifera TaxID=42345 RepID=A0A8B7CQA3_PHODC|nr:E3 ubiquitin-protein ligase RNF43-like [Phoenix dactylifera]